MKDKLIPISGVNVTKPAVNRKELHPGDMAGARQSHFPSQLSPMLATLIDAPFTDTEWLFEPKLDGYRALAFVQGNKVSLRSRRGLSLNDQFPYLVESLSKQTGEIVLDGEIVALDEKGRPCFQCLQQSKKPEAEQNYPTIYYVFDILYFNGYDLRDVHLIRRKALLQKALQTTDRIWLLDYFEGDGRQIYQAAVSNGLEGVMAKHKESVYESGIRSRKWLKIKATLSDEFIIGGYTVGLGSRTHTFGALLLGYYDEKDRLVYAGQVGSGFNEALLVDLKERLDAIRSDRCPFVTRPKLGETITWVRPELVAEVKFAEWTSEGYLRAPVFMRLRDDKSPVEVRRTAIATADPVEKVTGVNDTLKQLQNTEDGFLLEVEGHRIPVTNLNKELWRSLGRRRPLTKRDLLIYLTTVSTHLLPHLKDRPITLTRYPGGIQGEQFYQKHWPAKLPEFVETVPLHSEHVGGVQQYLMCNNLPSLLWLGQLADIELHTWFSRINPEPDLRDAKVKASERVEFFTDRPDFLIFDLDPYIYSGKEARGAEPELSRKGFMATCEVALWLKEVLDSLSLASFIKTSGRSGLHVYVPIVRKYDYRAVRSAAQTIGRFLMERHPEEITMDWAVERRTGKVFVDHNQNVRGKTLASVYSPRPTPLATVSTPLRWDELKNIYPEDFTMLTLPERLERTGDLWSEILDAKRELILK